MNISFVKLGEEESERCILHDRHTHDNDDIEQCSSLAALNGISTSRKRELLDAATSPIMRKFTTKTMHSSL